MDKRVSGLGMLFVVGGPGKSGVSTISKMLEKYYNLRRISGGELMRKYAKEINMSIEEFIKYIYDNNLEEKYDRKVDMALVRYSNQKDMLIESKIFAALCFKYSIQTTVKIWLEASVEVRAERTLLKEGKVVDRNSDDYRKALESLKNRYNMDRERYKKIYGIDYSKPKLYNDIVIDSSKLNEVTTFNLILDLIKDGGYLKPTE